MGGAWSIIIPILLNGKHHNTGAPRTFPLIRGSLHTRTDASCSAAVSPLASTAAAEFSWSVRLRTLEMRTRRSGGVVTTVFLITRQQWESVATRSSAYEGTWAHEFATSVCVQMFLIKLIVSSGWLMNRSSVGQQKKKGGGLLSWEAPERRPPGRRRKRHSKDKKRLLGCFL